MLVDRAYSTNIPSCLFLYGATIQGVLHEIRAFPHLLKLFERIPLRWFRAWHVRLKCQIQLMESAIRFRVGFQLDYAPQIDTLSHRFSVAEKRRKAMEQQRANTPNSSTRN